MRVVVALGGNALLRRGEEMTAEAQFENVRAACAELAPIAEANELVLCHGNGPQVGLLALQAAAYEMEAHLPSYPLDVLGAQTQGMIGYMLELELGNLLPFERPLATLLTMIEVDPEDQAFKNPTKFIGPMYKRDEADSLAAEKGWTFKQDGDGFRRVVPSPRPKRVFEQRQIDFRRRAALQIRHLAVDARPVAGVVGVEIDADRHPAGAARHDRVDVGHPGAVAVVIAGGQGGAACHGEIFAWHAAKYGGSGEIRTHGWLAPSPVFKTGALNRSATLP